MADTERERLVDEPLGSEDHVPRSVIAAIVMWALLVTLQLVLSLPRQGDHAVYETVTGFSFTILLVGFVAVSLLTRSRMGWLLVALAQALWIVNGIYNLAINDDPFERILEMRQIPFYLGALPIVVGIVDLILIALPSSRRWAFGRQGSLTTATFS